MRTEQHPTDTVVPGPGASGTRRKLEHPAFGMIGINHVHGGVYLNGSDFEHHNFIVLKVYHGTVERDLSRDWHHADSRCPIVEVALSEAQWATMICSPNISDGVPCTLLWTEKDGMIPAIAAARGETDNYAKEVKETVQDAIDRLTKALDNLKMPAGVRHEIEMARQELRSNLPFVTKSFGEHMEERVEKAKVEVAAYIGSAISRAGLQALSGHDPIALPSGQPQEDA